MVLAEILSQERAFGGETLPKTAIFTILALSGGSVSKDWEQTGRNKLVLLSVRAFTTVVHFAAMLIDQMLGFPHPLTTTMFLRALCDMPSTAEALEAPC